MPSTIPTAAGTISVPMSTLFDALEGVLTDEQRDQLFEELIGLRPSGVAPGDLITAELFNDLIKDVNALLARVALLEGAAGGPVIEKLDPPTTVAVNRRLTIHGRNFNADPRLNKVTIGDVEIAQLRNDSGPTALILAVPDLFDDLPATLSVRVETGERTSNALPITVKEEKEVQQGSFAISPALITGGTKVGEKLTFSWTVQALTTLEDKATLSVEVPQAQGATAAAWLKDLALDPASPLAIAPGETKTVKATVTVPTGATTAQFQLKVVSADQAVKKTSDPAPITVGTPAESSDTRIELSFIVPGLGGGGAKTGDVEINGTTSSGVLITAGTTGKLKFTARDKRPAGTTPAADFQFSAQFEGPAQGLTSGAPVPATVTGVPAGDDRNFDLTITAPAGAQIGATTQLKVTCSQTKNEAAIKPYKAFRTIPVKIS